MEDGNILYAYVKIEGRNTTKIPNLCCGDSERGERKENDEGSDTVSKESITKREKELRENSEEEEFSL